jgi:S-DNA-T family DNA segregation ATPase FtsK/SpoIIIE
MSLDMNPELPPHWDLTKVIPGELEVPDDLSGELDDDIAPGVLLPYEPAYPMLRKTGSAAMVVASVTGRAVGLSVRGSWTAGRWFAAGLGAVSFLGWRYLRSHDYQEAIGGVTSSTDWRRNTEIRHRRWKFLGWGAGALAALNLAGWWALVAEAGMTAADSWWITPGVLALSVASAVTWYGRYRLNNTGLAPEQIVAEQDDPTSDEPFPLAVAQSPDKVEQCVTRALAWEGIDTRAVRVLGYRGWGWEIDVVLKGAAPEQVNAVMSKLDSHFGIGKGQTLCEPDPEDNSHLTLRLVQSDPFADMPRPSVHSPNSLSVKDAVVYGRCMDGTLLEMRLRGMFMMVIGSSGSAKTKGALRCLAEVITACRDAIAIEMDPVKDGIREFSEVMALPPIRGPKECTEKLRWLRDIASARNQVKSAKEMGDLWEPTPEEPAIFGLIDEFIFLPKEAKELAIEILRIGRETGVYLLFAAQEATQDSLGDAIASAVTYRVMLAARSEDIPLVLGKGASAAGYRPDRLRPAVDDERVYDAGKFYIAGPGFDRPVLWRWNRFERDQIRQAVKDRKDAGRPWFDHASLAAANLLHVIRRDGAAGEASLADRLVALDEQGGVEDAATVAVLLRAFGAKTFLPTTEELLPALGEAGVQMDANGLSQLLRKHAPSVTAIRQEWDGRAQVRGWSRESVEQAAAGLLGPTMARLRAA